MRRGHHNVSVLERSVLKTTGNEATDVANIGKQVRTDTVADISEAVILDLTRIGRSSSNNEFRFEL